MELGRANFSSFSRLRSRILLARDAIVNWQRFKQDFRTFNEMASFYPPRFEMAWKNRLAMLGDRTAGTGFDRHYIYHTAWAARKVRDINPARHVDIGSSLFFAGMISAFLPVEFYDFRPAALDLDRLKTAAADLTRLQFADGAIESLSCMHVVEHIGLGRYGDAIDPNGDRKAMSELARVISPGGSLLFVVPIGKPAIRFNAHRIYAYRHVIEAFSSFSLLEFSLIPDRGPTGLICNATEAQADSQKYGCGCFWFRRDA